MYTFISCSLASIMDAFADIEQLTYGESALREIVTFILTFSLEKVISAEGMDGEVIYPRSGKMFTLWSR